MVLGGAGVVLGCEGFVVLVVGVPLWLWLSWHAEMLTSIEVATTAAEAARRAAGHVTATAAVTRRPVTADLVASQLDRMA